MPLAPDLRIAWNNPDFQNVAVEIPPPAMTNATAALRPGDFVAHAAKSALEQLNKPIDLGDAMADPTREEFDAKLATVEARAEGRFIELSGKIDRVVDQVSALNSTIAALTTNVRDNFIDLREEVRHVRTDNKFTRISIIIAVVASVLAGLGALWLTQANLLAAFQSGAAIHETPLNTQR